jgi:pimeloyl-ACP methyl ester carboxylesterase
LTGLGERSHLSHAGINLSLHIADVVNVLKWERLSDVVLCGHSYGGFVISGVVEKIPETIGAMVFVDALVPESGDTVVGSVSPTTRDHIEDVLARGETIMAPMSAAGFKVNEKDRAWIDSLCTPQPLGTFTKKIILGGARQAVSRKIYVRAKNHISPGFDAAVAKVRGRPTWRIFEVACGHDIMVDMPDKLAEILEVA